MRRGISLVLLLFQTSSEFQKLPVKTPFSVRLKCQTCFSCLMASLFSSYNCLFISQCQSIISKNQRGAVHFGESIKIPGKFLRSAARSIIAGTNVPIYSRNWFILQCYRNCKCKAHQYELLYATQMGHICIIIISRKPDSLIFRNLRKYIFPVVQVCLKVESSRHLFSS